MARFTATVDVRADPQRVWQRLTDWPAHERWVPLTTITVLTDEAAGVGARFVARSGVGRLGFDDPMQVTRWQPPAGDRPGHCSLVKLGRLVTGTAELQVRALRSGLTRAAWSEQIELAPARLTAPFGPLIGAAGRFGFGRALRAMARELEAEER